MIHALPGMGADHRMFPAPWGDLPEFAAHDWPAYRGERTLAEAARAVCDACDIRDGDTLIGASLGGMIACEVAKIRKLDALYLVGSATSKGEVNHILALLRPLIALTPFEWLQFSAGKVPSEMARMYAGVDADFVRSMCHAIFEWEGLGPAPVRCFRLHGRRDLVVPPPSQCDLLLDGGHLISMTHPRECVAFIQSTRGSANVPPAL
jgi:pimeloyl-ACP methyl ester carboxylesterase